jgi:hypothetical protein
VVEAVPSIGTHLTVRDRRAWISANGIHRGAAMSVRLPRPWQRGDRLHPADEMGGRNRPPIRLLHRHTSMDLVREILDRTG